MALPDKEINTVLEMFNQRCLEDAEFARMAEENPISAFDMLARMHEAQLEAEIRGGFPVEVQGMVLTDGELSQVRCGSSNK